MLTHRASTHALHCVELLIAVVLAGRALAADADSLYGIHWWGHEGPGNPIDQTPASLLNSVSQGAYDTEIVNTHDGYFWSADWIKPLYLDLKQNENVTPLTRIDYQYGQTVPSPMNPDYANWSGNVVGIMNVLRDGGHIWQLGNEPNLTGEGGGWTNKQITPAAYAAIYQNVHTAMTSNAAVGAAGQHELLIAPPSPGGIALDGNGEGRWMDGNDWLGAVLDAIPDKSIIDGIALHAYGGGDATASYIGFRSSLAQQIALIDNKGLTNVPIYVTEFNRYTDPNNPSDEATSAQFVRDAYKFLDRWNRTPGNHNIVSASWFVYDANDQAGGGWNGYSIEYWKDHGLPQGNAGDLYTAFHDTVSKSYKAGIAGCRPIPAGVQIFDDFESGDGRFNNSPTFSGTSQGYGSAFKVTTPDDSWTRSQGQKIGVTDGDTPYSGWLIRHLSGGGAPSSNVPINLTAGPDGNIGFYLRVFTNTRPDLTMKTSIVLDSGASGATGDQGVYRDIIADGDWHWYEWSLDTPADWTAWRDINGNIISNSDGVLPLGQVTIDSILFRGNDGQNAEFFIDTVMRNANGSIAVMAGVPEPNTVMLALSAVSFLVVPRRRACHFSGKRSLKTA